MKRSVAITLAACVVLSSLMFAQPGPGGTKPASKPIAAPAAPDKATLQHVLDAWATMNPENARKYYDQAPENVFYDVAPLKYVSFKEYAAGVTQLNATLLSAVTFTLNDDVVFHTSPDLIWSTATVKTVMTDKAGKATALDCRWTTIWHKKGADWAIVHDHFSAPMEPPR